MPNIINNLTERSFVAETSLAVFNTSFLLPVVTFPVKECYVNWKKVFTNEYQIRSLIRAMIITGSFAVGPILVKVGNAPWLYNRAYSLYTGLPILNQLPETAGVVISSAFIFSYFCAWIIVHATNFFNHFRYGGAEHYLTPNKKQEILNVLHKNKFNISIKQIEDIFNKINLQLRKDPNNDRINNLILALRRGDLQTVLDQAHLLEAELNLIKDKIYILSNSNNALYQEQPISTGLLSPRNSISPPDCNVAEELNETPTNPQRPPSRLPGNFSGSASGDAEAENSGAERLAPPVEAIMYQYHRKSKNKLKFSRRLETEGDLNKEALNNLKQHQNKLEGKRFIAPGNHFTM